MSITNAARADASNDRVVRRRDWCGRGLAWICTCYLLSLLVFWAVLRLTGDRWWLATILLFGPRWLCSLPLVVLLPLAAYFRRRQLVSLAVAFVIILFPILDLRIPWRRALNSSGPPLRVFTYNVCADTVPAEALAATLRELKPDLVALQECRPATFQEVFRDWHVCSHGELLLAARFPIRVKQVQMNIPSRHTWPRATLLECTGLWAGREISVCTVHLPSPRYGLTKLMDRSTILAPRRSDLLRLETAERDAVSAKISAAVAEGPPDRLIVGDFNMTTDSWLYRRDWSPYANAFTRTGWGFGRTMLAPLQGFVFGIRIDQVLASGDWSPVCCWVGPDLGSDHLPVIADFVWLGPDPTRAPRSSDTTTQDALPQKESVMSTPAAATKTPPSTPSARPSATPELRTWTSLSGHQLEATLVEMQDGQVRLRKRDGKRILIQFDQLSPEDQQYVRNWQTES